MQTDRIWRELIKIGGWLIGLLAAGLADYWILPRLAARTGGKVIPIAAGLVIGSLLIYLAVAAASWLDARRLERVAKQTEVKAPRRKTPAEQIPLGSRIVICLLAVLVAAGMLVGGNGLPLILR